MKKSPKSKKKLLLKRDTLQLALDPMKAGEVEGGTDSVVPCDTSLIGICPSALDQCQVEGLA